MFSFKNQFNKYNNINTIFIYPEIITFINNDPLFISQYFSFKLLRTIWETSEFHNKIIERTFNSLKAIWINFLILHSWSRLFYKRLMFSKFPLFWSYVYIFYKKFKGLRTFWKLYKREKAYQNFWMFYKREKERFSLFDNFTNEKSRNPLIAILFNK